MVGKHDSKIRLNTRLSLIDLDEDGKNHFSGLSNSIPQATNVNLFKIDFRKFLKLRDHIVMQIQNKNKYKGNPKIITQLGPRCHFTDIGEWLENYQKQYGLSFIFILSIYFVYCFVFRIYMVQSLFCSYSPLSTQKICLKVNPNASMKPRDLWVFFFQWFSSLWPFTC